ncbi:jacalin lectin-like protein [Arabidopsis thaliana]|uniref:Jacalin-related lectin 15 n=1 Tax=Arabidopsis thaliana TaxID=3702 RepID=JA15S_ARATH|nr:jacalin lectin-like protein [Arabidopsis thaliana]F4I9R6.2 RecName: Full=Jacalin-related lectin 15; AltName: Full=Protein JACALIN-TYPE LECTIN REQUIRED FOR POTEXVIRUS RESISTANCE1 [Arabidopsis thaliana]AEE33504.2 jacalin lectin-like protein [Arabidopsis thaliana]|eukprot:NP_176112.3 jacalin lectin-like protein [Arabidopsis thaliana]
MSTPSGSNPLPMADKLEAKGRIASIKFDYVKNGQPKAGSTHGVSYHNFTEWFDLNHTCDEHILSVKCYYDDGEIQGLVIKTNIRTSAYMGYNIGTTFTLEVKGKKIVGFHGSFDKNLTSLGAYFAPLSPAK